MSQERATVTWKTIKDGEIAEIKRLLNRGELNLDSTIKSPHSGIDRPLLHMAAYHAKTDTVELLLNNGFDPNQKDSDGDTPLYYALSNSQYKTAQLLLQNGENNDEHIIGSLFREKDGHRYLIRFMESLGYFIEENIEGLCVGYVYLGVDALLINGGLIRFRHGIASIYKIVKEARIAAWKTIRKELLKGIFPKEEIKKYFYKKVIYNIQCQFDKIDKDTINDIRSRCDKIELFQNIAKYPQLFPSFPKPDSQNAYMASSLCEDTDLKERGGKIIVGETFGVYDLEEWEQYFTQLRKILSDPKFPHPIVFKLGLKTNLFSGHTMAIGFDQKKKNGFI